ncbi:MAG: PAS domain S-box protein [Bacteroidales bacterium]|nr:PAS domain S-box protein [Bacteroidales bacterium]
MDLNLKYNELLEKNRQLEKELNSLRLENNPGNRINNAEERTGHGSKDAVFNEFFKTAMHYLSSYHIGDDNRFYITGLNKKVEEVELIEKDEVLGKCIDDAPLAHRDRLIELLYYLLFKNSIHRLSASSDGDESEGYYMGFLLPSRNIVVTWEPGSEQKNLDDLYRQEIIFEKFAEMLPEMIYEVDLNGKVIYANHRSLNFFGYTREDLKRGLSIADSFPESYQEMVKNLKALKLPGQTVSNEYMARKKNGTLSPVVTHSFAIFLEDRKIGYRGILKDISRQREYENQIKREKAFLEHLYNSIPSAIAITNPDNIISMVNMEFTSLFGYKSEEAVNKNINDLIIPDDLKEEVRDIDALNSMNNKETKETIRKNKSGNKINVSLVATAIVINGKIVAHLIIFRDITAEKKNQLLQEILFNISTAALKQYDIKEIYPIIVNELSKIWDTNNFFIALYNKAADTISLPFFSDEKDNFKELPAAKTITGWVIKQNKSVLLKEKDQKMLEEKGDIDLIGTPCKVWMGVPLKVEDNIIGVMCLQDYHDENKFSQDDLFVMDFIANQIAIALQRRMMFDNLVLARQKAEDAAQTKQMFMSTMSHEIRTPLNEVIGITNLLLQGNPREDQMDFIRTLKFSGNHLLTLVNDVLDYNKIESNKIIFEQTQFNLSDFLNEIMRSYSFRSKTKNLIFNIKKSINLPDEVIGDSIRLNQILSNLLSNALKFTNQGSINVIINELSRTGNKSTIEFSVIDTGIGIAKDKHKIIFESFTQASPDTTRQYGGTGLGLAICKKLIELQGGTISLESEPGKGSTFRFVITLGVSEKSGHLRASELPENYTGLEGKKILIAEDNKINFFVANKFLSGWGIKVTHVENGQLALEKLEKEDFDLVLMDLHMPIMDGIEATRIIRNSEKPEVKNIPIVALTAAIMSESHDKIDGLNINDYVLKPFKPHDLFERILKHVR